MITTQNLDITTGHYMIAYACHLVGSPSLHPGKIFIPCLVWLSEATRVSRIDNNCVERHLLSSTSVLSKLRRVTFFGTLVKVKVIALKTT